MKLGLINSAWVQANRPTSFGLEMTKKIGFDSIDLFLDPLDIDSMVRFLDDVGHPAVKANIDISHLLLSEIKPAELSRLKGRASHVHCRVTVHGLCEPNALAPWWRPC